MVPDAVLDRRRVQRRETRRMALGADENERSAAGRKAVAGDGGGDALGGARGRGARSQRTGGERKAESRHQTPSGAASPAISPSAWTGVELFCARAAGDQCRCGTRQAAADRQAGGRAMANQAICRRQAAVELGEKAQAQRRAQTAAPKQTGGGAAEGESRTASESRRRAQTAPMRPADEADCDQSAESARARRSASAVPRTASTRMGSSASESEAGTGARTGKEARSTAAKARGTGAAPCSTSTLA